MLLNVEIQCGGRKRAHAQAVLMHVSACRFTIEIIIKHCSGTV